MCGACGVVQPSAHHLRNLYDVHSHTRNQNSNLEAFRCKSDGSFAQHQLSNINFCQLSAPSVPFGPRFEQLPEQPHGMPHIVPIRCRAARFRFCDTVATGRVGRVGVERVGEAVSTLRLCLTTVVVRLHAKLFSISPDVVCMNLLGTMDDDGVCTTVPGPSLSLMTSVFRQFSRFCIVTEFRGTCLEILPSSAGRD